MPETLCKCRMCRTEDGKKVVDAMVARLRRSISRQSRGTFLPRDGTIKSLMVLAPPRPECIYRDEILGAADALYDGWLENKTDKRPPGEHLGRCPCTACADEKEYASRIKTFEWLDRVRKKQEDEGLSSHEILLILSVAYTAKDMDCIYAQDLARRADEITATHRGGAAK